MRRDRALPNKFDVNFTTLFVIQCTFAKRKENVIKYLLSLKIFLFKKIKRDHQSTSTLFTGTLFHWNSYLKLIRSWPHLATSLKRYFLRPKRPDPLDISWSHLKFFQAAS